MAPFTSRFRYGPMVGLSLTGILGVQGLGLAAPANPAPPPSLATAAEMLSERKLFEAGDVVSKLGLVSPDTTENERVRLYLVQAIQRGASDEVGAQSAIAEALKLDRGAQMPAFASPDARRLLEEHPGQAATGQAETAAPLAHGLSREWAAA